MTEFLEGKILSERIKAVVEYDNLWCAVAFWGHGVVTELFGGETLDRSDVQVICDLSMGATNPTALRALGAPNSKNIRYLNDLHAKVYISDFGAVIGSANASRNGIGFNQSDPGLLEAGVFVPKNSDVWRAAAQWFDLKFEKAQVIGDAELNEAQLEWDTRLHYGVKKIEKNSGSFLDYDPDRHGLVYLLWWTAYPEDDKIKYIDKIVGIFDEDECNHLHPNDLNMRQSWACNYRVGNSGLLDQRCNPRLFYITDKEPDAVSGDNGYVDIVFQRSAESTPVAPFNFSDKVLLSAFRSIMSLDAFAPLRGDGETPWLARDHIELMHRFWRQVQDEYRRNQNQKA